MSSNAATRRLTRSLKLALCLLAVGQLEASSQQQPEASQSQSQSHWQLVRQFPPAASCFISQQHNHQAQGQLEPTHGLRLFAAGRRRKWQQQQQTTTQSSRSNVSTSTSSSTGRRPRAFLMLAHTTNNSVERLKSPGLKVVELPTANSTALQRAVGRQQQLVFESICGGWRNSLEPNSIQQPAYWMLDKSRAALVAKFDFYSTDFTDLTGHEAKLSSPMLRPIPAYHSLEGHPHYNSCSISFSFYMTIRADLELLLVPVPVALSHANKNHSRATSPAPPLEQQTKLLTLATINKSPGFRGLVEGSGSSLEGALRSSFREQDQWRELRVTLPTDLNHQAPYWLLFSAIPAVIKQDSVQKHPILHGVAIANISMAPQCFGLVWDQEKRQLIDIESVQEPRDGAGVALGQQVANFMRPYYAQSDSFELILDDSEWETGADQLTGAEGTLASWLSSVRFSSMELLEGHRVAILLGCVVILVVLLATSQWLLWLSGTTTLLKSAQQMPAKRWQRAWCHLLELFSCCLCCCCCWRYLGCCPKLSQKHKVYISQQQQQPAQCQFQSRRRQQLAADSRQSSLVSRNKKNISSISNGGYHQAQESTESRYPNLLLDNYLCPLSATIFEHVELNENPNYLTQNLNNIRSSISQQQQQQNGQSQSLFQLPSSCSSSFLTQLTGSAAAESCLSVKLNAQLSQLESYFLDRKRLTLTEPLGKGAFGEVYRGCLVYHWSGQDDEENNFARPSKRPHAQADEDDELANSESHSKLVAVKTLTDERMSQLDFIKEAINMAQVKHRNIVRLFGVCFDEKPLYIVMELLQGGNLKNFLIKNRDKDHHGASSPALRDAIYRDQTAYYNWPDANNNTNQPNQQTDRVRLCMGDLLVFALDIARACAYLQKKQIIHRDLAARNCLLTSSIRAAAAATQSHLIEAPKQQQQHHHHHLRSFLGSPPSALEVDANHKVDLEQVYLNGYLESQIVAKLADFGMTREVESKDYYRMVHKEVPIRWMPPECLDGVATTKSDVWSYGVFLWELFSMGQLPYQNLLNNHQVIEFIKSRRHAPSGTGGRHSSNSKAAASSLETRPLLSFNSSTDDVHQLAPSGSSRAATLGRQPQSQLYSNLASASSSHHLLLEHEQIQQQQQQHQLACTSSLTSGVAECIEGGATQRPPNELHTTQPTGLQLDSAGDLPPLPLPHDNTPHPIYSIMCSCWAANPEERPQFEEIANRLFWCLQMGEVLETSLPCFYEPHTPNAPTSTQTNLKFSLPAPQHNRSQSLASRI